MASPKLSTFLIMMLMFIMFLVGGITPFISDLQSNYYVEGYNESKLSAYNKLAQLQSNVNSTKEKALGLQSQSGVLDVLGGFFEAGYGALQTIFSSFEVFYIMGDTFSDDVGLNNLNIFWGVLATVVLVVIIIGIIVSTVVKRET